MGKAIALPAALLLLVAALAPQHTALVTHAQSSSLPCSAQPALMPMQGHYTGPWHSDGEYHFLTLGYDVDLKVVIDGTLDLTVTPDGHVSGTASGSVDAPIYDQGSKDVSSGYGTISGSVVGVLSGAGSLLVLTHPVIDMHWGTFVGGGYTVERSITMPDYHLTSSALDCVSASGRIDENGFPEQYIVADSTGQMSYVPGIGTASGTWQMTSTDAARFANLSAQVDSFISMANGVLAGTSLTPAQVDALVIRPLHDLEATINANPNISRCLLERLAAWERFAVGALGARASSASPTTLTQFRSQADLLRVMAAVNADCSLSDGGTSSALQTALMTALHASLTARDWPQAALETREMLLWKGEPARSMVQQSIGDTLHERLQSVTDSKSVLELARAAYVFADDADAAAAYKRLSTVPADLHLRPAKKKKKVPKKHSPKPKPKPTPTSIPKPSPTLQQVMTGGITTINAPTPSDGTFSWPAVKDATRYIVTVFVPSGPIAWSWSGSATSVKYGETALDGVAGSSGDGWSISLPSGYVWTVTALDSQGGIVGLKLR